jgi:uncharacterized membrane protein
MMRFIARRELVHAQIALFIAIALQLVVFKINGELLVGPQYLLIPTEIVLALFIGITARNAVAHKYRINHLFALILLGMISVGNISSLILVLNSLIITHTAISGPALLTSAIAIFITNIIVFALWYWEIDSPGLSQTRWTKNDKDFQFPQQSMKADFPNWRSEFLDYLYVSMTNAINFAAADAKPLTHAAKLLMGTQALISVLTLALVVARSVNILGG